MRRLIAVTVLVLATTTVAKADHGHNWWWNWGWGDHGSDKHDHYGSWGDAPEIDPTTGLAAITLLVGGVLILRARRKK
jgi:hypothetical protein